MALERMWQPIFGGFVWTDDRLGIGRLIGRDGSQGTVEFNHSAVQTQISAYELRALRRAYLPLQTRVYHRRADRWFLGRVLDRYVRGNEPASYLVKFPGYQPIELPEAELRVRCLLPLADPTEVLAAGALEVQFLADRRARVLEELAHARRVSRSLGGLLSASVELLPHQVEVVRRITEDPIQRYLLADEVGLGKTIEAAAVICQALLDHPKDHIVVATPTTLVRQWRQELLSRFGLAPDSEVRVVAFDSMGEVAGTDIDLLVVDEVHHLVAGRDGSWRESAAYSQLATLARSVPRLLLLSATPVLGEVEATLALLHLLDPDRYRLDDRNGFELRLRNRQEFGRLLLSLNPDSSPYILKRAIGSLDALILEDEVAAELSRNLSAAIDGEAELQIPQCVRALRDHITETYRLNRRLLRTRRRDMEGWELSARKSQMNVEVDEDSRIAAAWDALEEWRYRSLMWVHPGGARTTGVKADGEGRLVDRYVRLLTALGRGVDAFADELSDQLSSRAEGVDPTFPEEAEIAERVVGIRSEANEGMDRAEHAAALIDLALRSTTQPVSGVPKVVAFTSSTAFVKEVAAGLTALRGGGVSHVVVAGMPESAVEAAVGRFRLAPIPAALISDMSGEEGLNLQLADAVVHLDLPFDPLRVEQRTGRLDRIGRRSEMIRHRVVVPSDEAQSPWQAWLDMLEEGFRVFDQTIADIQFALPNLVDMLTLALFRVGAVGIRDLVSPIHEMVADERRRLDEQYALDRLEMGESDAHILFEQLEEAERSDRKLAASLNSWWQDVLRLERSSGDDSNGVFTLSWTDRTLAPREPWEATIQSALGKPLTFERDIALRSLGTRLVRSGNPLVEALPRFLRYDDRGTAFATWRLDPSWSDTGFEPWIGFKLSYVIELDAEAVAGRLWKHPDPVQTAALQRRADLLFPPWVEVHFVDTALTPVDDDYLRAILERPYDKRPTKSGRRDFNLAGRIDALHQVVDPATLEIWCRSVRDVAPSLVHEQDRFKRHLSEARQAAALELAVRTARLERRLHAQVREATAAEASLQLEIAMAQELLREVETPAVRLDSIGLIIVSHEPPNDSGLA
jgi:ATP-dependent helicase HepA